MGKIGKRAVQAIPAGILVVCALVVVSPVLLSAVLSLEDGLSAYADFWLWKPSYLYALANSLTITICAVLGTLVISVPAAYVFARIAFRGRGFLFYLYIIVMMMPFQVTLLPQYMVSKAFSVYDTPLALILPGIFAPFAVFLLTQILKSMPEEMLEAARLDTDFVFVILWKVVVPAARPGIICAGVLTFTEQWNAAAEPLVLLETEAGFPLSVLLSEASAGDCLTFAAVTVFMLLPLLLFGVFEEEIIEGLGAYGWK